MKRNLLNLTATNKSLTLRIKKQKGNDSGGRNSDLGDNYGGTFAGNKNMSTLKVPGELHTQSYSSLNIKKQTDMLSPSPTRNLGEGLSLPKLQKVGQKAPTNLLHQQAQIRNSDYIGPSRHQKRQFQSLPR